MEKLVEAANEGFVEVAHAADDGIEAVLDFFRILRFQIVVDQNDHRKRESLGREHIDSLLDVVFQNAKFVFAEIGYQAAGAVFYGDGQDHQVGVNSNLCPRIAQPRQVRRWRGSILACWSGVLTRPGRKPKPQSRSREE